LVTQQRSFRLRLNYQAIVAIFQSLNLSHQIIQIIQGILQIL
jgi:hypothetical protein